MCNPTKTEAILMQGYYQQVATTADSEASVVLHAAEKIWVRAVIFDVAFYFGTYEFGNNFFKDNTVACKC